MKKSFLIAAAFAAATLGASMVPASALPLSAPAAVHETAQNGAVTEVRWHRHGGWRHHGRWHRHYGWRRGHHYGWRHHHRRWR